MFKTITDYIKFLRNPPKTEGQSYFDKLLAPFILRRLTEESMGVYEAIMEDDPEEPEYIFPDLIAKREKSEKFWDGVSAVFWIGVIISVLCVFGYFVIAPAMESMGKIDQLMIVIAICTYFIIASLNKR